MFRGMRIFHRHAFYGGHAPQPTHLLRALASAGPFLLPWYISAMDTKTPTLSTPAAIIIAGALVAGGIVYAFGFSPNAPGKAPKAEPQKSVPAVTDADHVLGSKNPKLTLVEYSDMECPYCGDFHPVLKQLISETGEDVAWVYRHFPLTQIHQNALPAALASECVAAAKGHEAFWAFIDAAFAQQQNLGLAALESLAEAQGLSKEDLASCMASPDAVAKIQAQFNDAVAAGGQGTPFTVVLDRDGERVATLPGTMPYPQLKAQIEALLAAQ